jgi:hypothetical protein
MTLRIGFGLHAPHILACRAARQTGCLIGYSTFYGTPPADSRFGRANDRFGLQANPATEEVLCTNPAALGGGSGELDPYFATTPFPGRSARSPTGRRLPCRLAGSPCPRYTGRAAGEKGAPCGSM